MIVHQNDRQLTVHSTHLLKDIFLCVELKAVSGLLILINPKVVGGFCFKIQRLIVEFGLKLAHCRRHPVKLLPGGFDGHIVDLIIQFLASER